MSDNDTSSALAALGHKILYEAVVAGGPGHLNAAGHKVIHALLSGGNVISDDVDAGGAELTSRLVFGVMNIVKLPTLPSHPNAPHSILLIIVMPDRNWRGPLEDLTVSAEPCLREGVSRMRAWNLALDDHDSSSEALKDFMITGARWSRHLQSILDAATETDARLIAWLESNAARLSADAARLR